MRAGRGRPLTPKQRSFNRLVAQVERLRAQLDTTQQALDRAAIFHAEHIQPRIAALVRVRTDLIRALVPYLRDTRLAVSDRHVLKSIVTRQLDALLEYDVDPPSDVRALFKELHGLEFDEAAAEDMDDARSELASMFQAMGLDVDLSGFQAGMDDAGLAAQAAQLADQLRAQASAAETAAPSYRRVSKREARAAERQRKVDEARKTSLTSIYRRLAKVLHPDLEPDPDARERKGQLMQELTAAHGRQDLHALLKLEMEWAHGAGDDVSRLADDALAVYNEALKQQAAELEMTAALLFDHPKYTSVVREMDFGVRTIADGPSDARALDQDIATLTDGLTALTSDRAIDEVRAVIAMTRGPKRRKAKAKSATQSKKRQWEDT